MRSIYVTNREDCCCSKRIRKRQEYADYIDLFFCFRPHLAQVNTANYLMTSNMIIVHITSIYY